MDKLQTAREIIAQTDKEIAELFEKRMQAIRLVAEHKKENGLPVFDSAREDYLINKNSSYVEDEEIREYYINFQKSTMDISKRFQRKILEGMNVAYCGVEGAFAHIAAEKIFPDGNKISYKDFKAAYEAVESGECDCAVLPIENSNAGEVGQVIDLIFSGSLYINNVYDLSVHHNLVALPGAQLEKINRVISHQQALDQCNPFIRSHNLKAQSCPNTAMAAQYVSQSEDLTLAAIASAETAKLYGLEVLKENINESEDNTTRFAVFSRSMHQSTNDHSIIVFVVPEKAGTLAKAINIIGNHGFNMRCIKSRAIKNQMWSYYFYVEINGNLQSKRGKYMLDELSDFCDTLKFVGTFNSGNKI
ncbi:MAG: bifunctional chorismate mutase/prephenate dehydratase [Acutalibacteraceae bacterium]